LGLGAKGLDPSTITAASAAEDRTLIDRITRGDGAALRALYDRCAPRALAIAQRILGGRAEAEEVVQETFIQVWKQAESYDVRRGGAMAWVVTIARSRAIDRLRSRAAADRAEAQLEEVDPPAPVAPAEEVEGRELREHVRRALATLPDDQRSVLELAYFQGLTQSEIASRLGNPLGTVKTRVRLGLARLAAILDGAVPRGVS
jgi:RNA polymerase sigma-70 factor (ECF subfamily)